MISRENNYNKILLSKLLKTYTAYLSANVIAATKTSKMEIEERKELKQGNTGKSTHLILHLEF